jgi:hypothetical protein
MTVRVRKAMIVFLYCLVASAVLCQILLFVVDPQNSGRAVIYTGIILVMMLSFIRALKRRNELVMESARAMFPAKLRSGEAIGQRQSAACKHITRGTGELVIDESGGLEFIANRTPKQIGELNWYDVDVRTASIGQLAGRLLRPFVKRRLLREFAQSERNLRIERERLQTAVAVDRMVTGPSIVVGYNNSGSHEVAFDEFALSSQDNPMQFAQPTADPAAWVRALNLVSSPQLEADALADRRRIHRRQSTALWLFCTVSVGIIMLVPFGVIGIALGLDESTAHIVGLVSIIGGSLWLITSLFIGAIIFATNR